MKIPVDHQGQAKLDTSAEVQRILLSLSTDSQGWWWWGGVGGGGRGCMDVIELWVQPDRRTETTQGTVTNCHQEPTSFCNNFPVSAPGGTGGEKWPVNTADG